MGLGEEDHRGKGPCAPHSITGPSIITTVITADVDLDHPAEAVFVRFLHVKFFFPPLSIPSSLEGSFYAQPTFKERGGRIHPLGDEVSS